jgi:hypothetical protein
VKFLAGMLTATVVAAGAQGALAQAPAAGDAPGAAAEARIKVPEGTEFPIRLEEAISSQSAQVGDRFTISLDDDVPLPDGTILRAGYRGVGEVVNATSNGMLGKSGKLNITLLYLRVGDQRIRLRANRGAEGEGRVGAQVASVILFWPVAPFIKGKNTTINKGARMTAYSDQDVSLAAPVSPPPPSAD